MPAAKRPASRRPAAASAKRPAAACAAKAADSDGGEASLMEETDVEDQRQTFRFCISWKVFFVFRVAGVW